MASRTKPIVASQPELTGSKSVAVAPLSPRDMPPDVLSLLPQRQIFCYAYLASNFNGTEAAIRAGYSPNTANEKAAQLLAEISVQKGVQALIARRAARHAQMAEDVVEELRRIGFGNMMDYVTIDGNGRANVDLSGLTRAQSACIQEITTEVVETIDGDPETGQPDRQVVKTKIKLYDKKSSLELLGRHLGLDFSDKAKAPLFGGLQAGKVNIQVVYENRKPPEAGDVPMLDGGSGSSNGNGGGNGGG